MKILFLIAFLLILVSCSSIQEDIIIDTSSHGAINMIKLYDNEPYVLNSTNSSIQKIDGDSLVTVSDIDINGRDFVLDFVLDGEDIYYSNTYDEIFKLKDNSIVDTFKVFSPDKIAKIGNDLIVTSRSNQEGQMLYSINTKSKKISEINISSSNSNGSKFGQSSLSVASEKIYVIDNSTKILAIFDCDLNKLNEIFLPSENNYGNMSIVEDRPVILTNENGKLAIFTIEVSLQHSKKTTDIDLSSTDIYSSAIDKNNVYLYDYIRGKIIIKNLENFK
ncbi:MAG: hypothetical protein JXR69_11320 [Candidatus Delongbacteria bacterium]|nr:hypothetical protein [Candidatus Delongbacteria bacterium]